MPIRVFSQEVKSKAYEFAEFVTLTHPNNKKSITKELLSKLNRPLCLAVWFMDDGCADYAGVSFNTQCFTKKEVDLLRYSLQRIYNLETTKRKNKNGWIIYIPKRSLNKFSSLVEKYLLPEFKYKLCPYSLRN